MTLVTICRHGWVKEERTRRTEERLSYHHHEGYELWIICRHGDAPSSFFSWTPQSPVFDRHSTCRMDASFPAAQPLPSGNPPDPQMTKSTCWINPCVEEEDVATTTTMTVECGCTAGSCDRLYPTQTSGPAGELCSHTHTHMQAHIHTHSHTLSKCICILLTDQHLRCQLSPLFPHIPTSPY